MKSLKFGKFLASLSFFACASLSAAPVVVDVTGIESVGRLDDPENTVLAIDVGANSRITSLAFDVNLTAYTPSFLSEMSLVFETSKFSESVTLVPGPDDAFSGTGSYSDFFDLVALGLDFSVGVDGILRLEFFEEGFDDIPGADGIWNFGTLTFGVEPAAAEVPEPSTTLLLGAGLAMLGYAGRHRPTGKAS